jgi:NADPH:quinone reductase-like Zn-dependent oxidoreductase
LFTAHPSVDAKKTYNIMTDIPKTMRGLVAPKYCKPDGYVIADLPVPSLKAPDELLIKVHAAGLMTGDTQIAAGTMKMLIGKSE